MCFRWTCWGGGGGEGKRVGGGKKDREDSFKYKGCYGIRGEMALENLADEPRVIHVVFSLLS